MTKKFAVAAKSDGAALNNAEFVVPAFSGSTDTFVGLKSGRSYSVATVVYTGVELSRSEVLSKVQFDYADETHARRIVDSFLAAVKSQKVGSPVVVDISSDGNVTLSRLNTKLEPIGRKPSLP